DQALRRDRHLQRLEDRGKVPARRIVREVRLARIQSLLQVCDGVARRGSGVRDRVAVRHRSHLRDRDGGRADDEGNEEECAPPGVQQDTHLWLFLAPRLSSSAMVSGYGCVRCTGPFAMSTVVLPSRLTALTSAPF